jgi:hypothetical protein
VIRILSSVYWRYEVGVTTVAKDVRATYQDCNSLDCLLNKLESKVLMVLQITDKRIILAAANASITAIAECRCAISGI